MSLKKILLIVLAVIFTTAAAAFAASSQISTGLMKLLEERQTDCWVEGTVFGEMILGARGSLQFIYNDAKLSEAIAKEQGLAPWIDDLNQYFGKVETKKRAMFIVQLKANKPWTVKESEIHVGGYTLTPDDIMQTSWKNPFADGGEINSGETWQFAFTVPVSELKKGGEITIGYGKDLVKWKVPK